MAKFELIQLDSPLFLKHFQVRDLIIESERLKNNPLKDSSRRHHYLLVPQKVTGKEKLVFHLSGYFSTGYQTFSSKTLERNFIEEIDHQTTLGNMTSMIHVFVDATTFWGGSQFINSPGCGLYSDHIVKELVPALQQSFPANKGMVVIGGSSGGYGALHLISMTKSPFQQAYAVAPDSFFEASLLPELRKMAPQLLVYGGNLNKVRAAVHEGVIQKKKSFFSLVHGIAMALCYSPAEVLAPSQIEFPIDLKTGILKPIIWKKWLMHDPIHFLKKRAANLKDKRITLEVGQYDDFSLQFGARQLVEVLKETPVKLSYQEFPGNHFELRERRLQFLKTL